MTKTYSRKYQWGTLEISADFAQSADTIRYRIDGGDWHVSPFQVASFQHNSRTALAGVNRWLVTQN